MKLRYLLCLLAICLALCGPLSGSPRATDTIAPSVTFTAPTNPTVTGDRLVQVSVYVTDQNLRKVTIGGPNSMVVMGPLPAGTKWGRGSLYWHTKGSAAGNYDFRCTAVDAAGNARTETLTLKLVR